MLLIHEPKTEKEKEVIRSLVLEQSKKHETFIKVPKDEKEQIEFLKQMIESFNKNRLLEFVREHLRMRAPLFQEKNMNLPVYISAEYGSEYDDENYFQALQNIHFYDKNKEWIDISEITFKTKHMYFDRIEEYELDHYIKERLESVFGYTEIESHLKENNKVNIWE